jgi:hypothetical protein
MKRIVPILLFLIAFSYCLKDLSVSFIGKTSIIMIDDAMDETEGEKESKEEKEGKEEAKLLSQHLSSTELHLSLTSNPDRLPCDRIYLSPYFEIHSPPPEI